MRKVGASAAKKSFDTLLELVEKGEEILITRHGKPVARLVPNFERFDHSAALAVADRIRVRAKSLRLGSFQSKHLKTERDKGRP